MPIKHGIYVSETDTVMQASSRVPNSVQVFIGMAPVYLLSDPNAVTGKPILITSAAEAKEKFGYSEDFEKFTLCQAMYVMEKFYQVSPVVFINCLDVRYYKKDVEKSRIMGGIIGGGSYKKDANILGADGRDIIVSSVAIETIPDEGETATEFTYGTDYTVALNPSTGKYVIYFINQDLIVAYNTTGVNMGYSYVNYTAMNNGVISSQFNKINDIYPTLGVVPSILVAPGYSKESSVASALSAKAANIGGMFKAVAVLDLDTELAATYTSVSTAKKDGHKSPFSCCVWPCFKASGNVIYGSVIASMLMAYTDSQNDGVPSRSPSNKIIASLGVVSTCLADGTDVVLDQDQANIVNTAGVITGLYVNGWRLWGSYTGAYPDEVDPKNIWLPVRRMFNWQGNSFIVTYFDKVDDPINAVLIESVVDSENIRCMAFAPDKWAGARIRFVKSDNPIEDLLAGKITFRQSIAPYTPAQEINNILSYDTTMLQDALYAVAVDE